jgi:hypothetical protein
VTPTVSATLPAGRVRLRFNGVLPNGRALRPGLYRVVVAAVDANGNDAAPKRTTFVLRPALR